MPARFHCAVCEAVEERCTCEKYCLYCLGSHEVRLVRDGYYYCLECREACDYEPEPKSAIPYD
jgi:hypothetical protein